MYDNECIDENFKDETRIAIMRQKISEKCGFNEATHEATTSEIFEKIQIIESIIEEKVNKFLEEQKRQNKIIENLITDKDRLAIDNKNLKVQIVQAENELKIIHEEINSKMREIDDLKIKLLNQSQEIAIKNEEIKKRDDKIEILIHS